jgi:hypothetical protein
VQRLRLEWFASLPLVLESGRKNQTGARSMARKRNPENHNLPPRWRLYHGAYYYQVKPGEEAQWGGKKQFRLGVTLVEAHREFASRIEFQRLNLTTIGQLLDRYALEVVPTKAPKSQIENQRAIQRLKPVFGHMGVTD